MARLGSLAVWSATVPLIKGCATVESGPQGTFAIASSGGDKASILVDISKVENQALSVVGGTLALGFNDLDWKGILLYRESETTVKAYSRECTHEQCTVRPFDNGVAACPCHNSKFSLSGERLSGPASKPLSQYPASINGNIITISA